MIRPVKAFLDTSVLIPVFYGDHVHHDASLSLFAGLKKGEAACAAHSLFEVYSVLTRMPGRHRIPPDQAMLFIGDIRQRLAIIALDPAEYATALDRCAAATITGGTAYDALIAACAVKAKTKTIYTWNMKHYQFLDGVNIRRP